jgi:hypothetical protein
VLAQTAVVSPGVVGSSEHLARAGSQPSVGAVASSSTSTG